MEEFLASACGKRGLNPAEHFVRVKKRRDMDNSNHFVPHRTDLIDSYVRYRIIFPIQFLPRHYVVGSTAFRRMRFANRKRKLSIETPSIRFWLYSR